MKQQVLYWHGLFIFLVRYHSNFFSLPQIYLPNWSSFGFHMQNQTPGCRSWMMRLRTLSLQSTDTYKLLLEFLQLLLALHHKNYGPNIITQVGDAHVPKSDPYEQKGLLFLVSILSLRCESLLRMIFIGDPLFVTKVSPVGVSSWYYITDIIFGDPWLCRKNTDVICETDY